MEKHDHKLKELFQKFIDNRTGPLETERLKELFDEEHEATLKRLVADELKNPVLAPPVHDEDARLSTVLQRIREDIKARPATVPLYKRYGIIAVAASLVLAIGALLYFGNKDENPKGQHIAASMVTAGSNKATLTLANGRTIDLSGAGNGELANDQGIAISKASDGQLAYTADKRIALTAGFNSIATPKGGEYSLTLPDGTKVRLNAASSLRYPLSLGASHERRVELTGEAYFEVAHDKDRPFIVKTAAQEVQVLGTHFNINSYPDEGKTVTILEEGSVRVTGAGLQALLRPGQQSILQADRLNVSPADLTAALAWKNGALRFRDADIQTIMRQVSRWYNIEVLYEGKVPARYFTGGLSRSAPLSDILDVFRGSGISFTVEANASGKRLIIKP